MLSSVCDQGRAGVECADNFARSYFGFAIVLLFFSRCAFEINDVLVIALSSRFATQSLECYFLCLTMCSMRLTARSVYAVSVFPPDG